MISPKWFILAICICLLVCLPIISIISYIPLIDFDTLSHLSQYVLPRYIAGSLIILIGVLILSALLGIISAYLVSFFTFSFSKFFDFALILPLAIPTYILGFVWVDLLEYRGAFFTLFQQKIDIMNNWGAITIISFALYPYVYFFCKNAFSQNLGYLILSAQTLGASQKSIFLKIILPFSRLSIVGSLFLVAMETLNEYGLVSYFGVDTFSAGIFRVWGGAGDEKSAVALSFALLVFVFVVIFLESYQRGHKGYMTQKFIQLPKTKLSGIPNLLAFFWCLSLFLLAFGFPMIWLLYWGSHNITENFFKISSPAFYSIIMSCISSILIVVIGFYLCFITRIHSCKLSHTLLKTSTLGYALPGAVIAIGVLVFLNTLNSIFNFFHLSYIISGSVAILFFGYLIRFLASSIFSLESAFAKIPSSLDRATFSLKHSSLFLALKIHTPLIKSQLALAFIIVLVEVLKELPISTILAASGYQSLASIAFAYSENEQIYSVALPSLIIVLFSLIPTLCIHFFNSSNGESNGKNP